jgi:alpha-tubulin suppressor-like RCC1 family protein
MAGGAVSAFVACNAIVGVTDVTYKRTTRDGGSSSSGDDDDNKDPNEPIDSSVTSRPNVLSVVLGEEHTCARKPAGTVQCWGDDTSGQTGTNGEVADAGIVVAPANVTGITDAVDIAAGRQHSCVAHKTGTVSCWGYNLDGQLGNGDTGKSDAPVDVKGINNAFLVAAGGSFSCAVRGTGTVACWGNNSHGQLGTGDQNGQLTPVVVTGAAKDVISITAGQSHTCIVKSDGSVMCWGEGENGQLGNGGKDPSLVPVAVTMPVKAVAVSAGERSTCALAATGAVYCWGANELGQLGTGSPNDEPNPSPIIVAGINDATAIATGRNHTCATRSGGTVVCWGDGAAGQLGDGNNHDGGAANAVTVTGLNASNRVGAGAQTSCATTANGNILCWGEGLRGELGAGIGDTNAPAQVTGYP